MAHSFSNGVVETLIVKCKSIKTISVTLDNRCFYNSIENGWAITSSRSPYPGMSILASITSLVNQVSVRNVPMVLGPSGH